MGSGVAAEGGEGREGQTSVRVRSRRRLWATLMEASSSRGDTASTSISAGAPWQAGAEARGVEGVWCCWIPFDEVGG